MPIFLEQRRGRGKNSGKIGIPRIAKVRRHAACERKNSLRVSELARTSATRLTCVPLSANDDRQLEEDDRQKTQGGGSRNKSNKIRTKIRTVQLFESVSFE
jgi:hypothetical protein